MDLTLTDEQKTLQETIAKVCKDIIQPNAERADRESRFPAESVAALADVGYLGMGFPEAYGGNPVDLPTACLAWEEVATACAATYLSVGASVGLCGSPILHFGTEKQKEKYLPGLASGKLIGAMGLTEPHCGSDAAALKTRAIKDGNDYILNGAKTLITNAPIADVSVIFAKTEPEKGHQGVSTFLIDRDTPGFETGKPFPKMGVKGSPTGEFFFNDCRIPKENLLGEENWGFIQAMQTLELGRIGMAMYSLGIARACLEECRRYAMEREAFGRAIAKFQAIHFKIADMRMNTHVARLLIHKAACLKEAGKPCATEASIAKLFSSEIATKISSDAVQIHGGYGYLSEYRVERLYRDAKLGEIGEGTSEIQRELIARDTIKTIESGRMFSV